LYEPGPYGLENDSLEAFLDRTLLGLSEGLRAKSESRSQVPRLVRIGLVSVYQWLDEHDDAQETRN
jgi:hypothetical protein